MEGWEELLCAYMDGFNGLFAVAILSLAALLGSLFIMILAMAILWQQYESSMEAAEVGTDQEEEEERDQATKPRGLCQLFVEAAKETEALVENTFKVWKKEAEQSFAKELGKTFSNLEELMGFVSSLERRIAKEGSFPTSLEDE